MTSRPFSVIYAFVLTEVFAAYVLIRGILCLYRQRHVYRSGDCGWRTRVLIAGATYFRLRFTARPLGSPAHDPDYPSVPVGHPKRLRHEHERGLNIGQAITIAGVIGAAAAFIFVLMPDSRRYVEGSPSVGRRKQKYSRRCR